MWIIGCDYHPRFQQIAFVNTETGEYGERRLEQDGEAEQFYRSLLGQAVRVGMEASGQSRWFERMLAELGYELWIGDPAKIRAAAVRKQKDRQARCQTHLGVAAKRAVPEAADLGADGGAARCAVTGDASAPAGADANAGEEPVTGGGAERRHGAQAGLWSRKGQEQFRAPLPAWTGQRRQDNLDLLAELEKRTSPLDQAVEQEAARRPEVQLLQTHPGVGPVTALAFVLTIGDPARFRCGKQVASYLGLIPAEDSSGGRQRLGHISKQGNTLLRGLLVEAAHAAVQKEPELRRYYRRLAMKKNRALAAVAVARKLAIRLWWMWNRGAGYSSFAGSGSHAGASPV